MLSRNCRLTIRYSLAQICTVLVLFCTGCITTGDVIIPSGSNTLKKEFVVGKFESSTGITLMTRTYYPKSSMSKFPLIVYLHGAGQNGSDNERQLDESVGCLYAFSHDRDDYKSIILAPQCPAGVFWRDDAILGALQELISKTAQNDLVDNERVYITGFSMGGDASWKLALADPSIAATIIPVCGGPLASMEPDIPDVPVEMSSMNIWAFNNFDDGVVCPTYVKRIMSELWDSEPNDFINFTMFVSGGHNPKYVYQNRDVLIWMMSTKRRPQCKK